MLMKIKIYYGGRGLMEDPALYVMNKLEEVLKEIRVDVERYNLFEEKSNISMLPQTLKGADGVILVATVEWFGIGGYMQQFLDACWFYGDKEKLAGLYMLPVVLSTTCGERDAEGNLIKAWEMLGGRVQPGLCAYVEDHVEFETNADYAVIIEKHAEALYRVINQKSKALPNSQMVMRNKVLRNLSLELTPQESEQLSVYVSDDTYVKKQKEDIQELTMLFKEMLGESKGREEDILQKFKDIFQPIDNFNASYAIEIKDKNKTLIVEIKGQSLNCYYGEKADADVIARTTDSVLTKIIGGSLTFQKAFMTGDIAAKGNFKTLRNFDTLFPF